MPCTLYPMTYTLHPVSCTLYPMPYTLNHISLTPYPSPCILHPIPDAHQVGVDTGEEVGRARNVRGLVFQVRGSVRTPPAARCASTVYARPNSIVFAFTFLGENLRNPSVFYRESSKRNASLGAFVRVGGNVLPVPRGAPAGLRNWWRPGRQRVKG